MPKDNRPAFFRHIRIKDGEDILEEAGEGVRFAGIWTGRESMAEHVRRHTGEAKLGEMVELVGPDVGTAAHPVQEE